jgi:hypothetical protein
VINQTVLCIKKRQHGHFFPALDTNGPPDVSVVVINYNTKHLLALARMLTALDMLVEDNFEPGLGDGRWHKVLITDGTELQRILKSFKSTRVDSEGPIDLRRRADATSASVLIGCRICPWLVLESGI